MSEERKQVLEMLAAGKVTAEEAERLLEKLEQSAGDGLAEEAEAEEVTDEEIESERLPRRHGRHWRHHRLPHKRLRFLRVKVETEDGDHVNARIPLALVRTGFRLSTMLPSEANEKLQEKGIDLSDLQELKGEELIEALRELDINVDTASGDKVRVFCE